MEATPGAALKLVSTQYLLDITEILLDRPPKMCPLDEWSLDDLIKSPEQSGCQFVFTIVGARVMMTLQD